jgi:hypothetical protein
VTAVLFAACSAPPPLHTIPGEPVAIATLEHGDLKAVFRDNSQSPRPFLSGVDALFNVRHAPDFDAFDPDPPGSSAGLNFEHIISGHADGHNAFAPRKGTYTLYRLPDGRSVRLERRREDDPWAVSSTLVYTLVEPHYIDFEFRCVPHDASRFGARGHAIFFWANYMNDVEEVPILFRGVMEPGGTETWIEGDAPQMAPAYPDWTGGGTYRHLDAAPVEYDADHNFKLNSWSYAWPRYTKPFYYGRAARDMTFILMFDRAHTAVDEVRFSIFKFKLPGKRRPAWDFQYVIHKVEAGREYGFRGRLAWKKYVSVEDCEAEYERWREALRR